VAETGQIRTCVGCRGRASRGELLRFVLRDGEPVPDPERTLPGRGAWLHDSEDCRALAERRGALLRALTRAGRRASSPRGRD